MKLAPRNPTHQRNWTRNEIQILQGYHGSGVDVNELVAMFNRSEKAIRAKAFYHGIKLGKLTNDRG